MYPCREECEANARLIAIAPDLLDILGDYLMLGKGTVEVSEKLTTRALEIVAKCGEPF